MSGFVLRSGYKKPDPSAAIPHTALGLMRLVFWVILTTLWGNQLTALMKAIGLPHLLNRVKSQLNKFNDNGSWDDPPKGAPRMKKSTQRILIANTFNAMEFPVKLSHLQLRIRAKGKVIPRHRIILYSKQMGMICKQTKKVINASTPSKCAIREQDAIAMKQRVDAEVAISYNKSSLDHRFFYYDQSPMNQYRLTDDMVLAPPGMIVYETGRNRLRSPHATIHAICDQYGQIVHHHVAAGGQGEEDILNYLLKAATDMKIVAPVGEMQKPLLFLDHLDAHVNILNKYGHKPYFPFSPMITPLSCPDASVIESVFGQFKREERKKLIKVKKTFNQKEWVAYIDEQLTRFKDFQECDDGLLKHTREYLDLLIQHEGDLQAIAMAKCGFSDKSAIKMQLLEQDQ